MTDKQLYTLNDLIKLPKEERAGKLEQLDMSKSKFSNELMTNPKFKKLPGKGVLIKKIGTMSEEQFKQFIVMILNSI